MMGAVDAAAEEGEERGVCHPRNVELSPRGVFKPGAHRLAIFGMETLQRIEGREHLPAERRLKIRVVDAHEMVQVSMGRCGVGCVGHEESIQEVTALSVRLSSP